MIYLSAPELNKFNFFISNCLLVTAECPPIFLDEKHEANSIFKPTEPPLIQGFGLVVFHNCQC